jgi:hypothetical protein
MTDAGRKPEPPQRRMRRLSIMEYELLSPRARAKVDALEEQYERERETWLASVKAQQKAMES